MRTDAQRALPIAALALIALTALYNLVEGVIAVATGIEAGSITLLAFGADSYVEVAAAAVIGWRLLIRDEDRGEAAERRAGRFIGWTFLVLAAAVTFQAVVSLAGRSEAEGSPLGVALLLVSLALMPLLSLAKLRLAARQHLPALAAEARETIACSYLSLTALVGVAATLAFGWWWVDAVAALALVPWLAREGLEGVKGEPCCEAAHPCFCRSCLFGVRHCDRPDACVPACC